MQAVLGDHIDLAAKQLFDLFSEFDERKSAAARDVLDEQVQIALRARLTQGE